MKLTLNRAQQRVLGLVGTPSPSDAEVLPVAHWTLSPDALQAFRAWLLVPGHLQGGPLFGIRQEETLDIRFVARNGYPLQPSACDPLSFDGSYLLGLNDALTTQSEGSCDWVGQWLMYPDRQLPDLMTDLAWVGRAQEIGLVDDLHIMVMVGWVEGQLTTRAYAYDYDLGQARLVTEGEA